MNERMNGFDVAQVLYFSSVETPLLVPVPCHSTVIRYRRHVVVQETLVSWKQFHFPLLEGEPFWLCRFFDEWRRATQDFVAKVRYQWDRVYLTFFWQYGSHLLDAQLDLSICHENRTHFQRTNPLCKRFGTAQGDCECYLSAIGKESANDSGYLWLAKEAVSLLPSQFGRRRQHHYIL